MLSSKELGLYFSEAQESCYILGLENLQFRAWAWKSFSIQKHTATVSEVVLTLQKGILELDVFHRNVIFLLNNSEERKDQEGTRNENITMMLHGEPSMNMIWKSTYLS